MIRLAVLSLCLALPAAARAAEPDDLTGVACALEQCDAGVVCPYAFDPDEPDGEWRTLGADCRAEAVAGGLRLACRDGDELAGDELFCPPDDAHPDALDLTQPVDPSSAPKPPTPGPKPKACAVHDGDGGLALLVLALGLARARRRR
jgi:MYXO-CTERM domain-containing protein